MPLTLFRRSDKGNWYIRGTIRGRPVYETTGTRDAAAAEDIRIKRESDLLAESIHGKKAVVLFEEAAESYLAAGGSARFLLKRSPSTGKISGVAYHFRGKRLRDLGQDDLDKAARVLFPNANGETRNRQCYTPFIAVWNHAVLNGWAEERAWRRPRKLKGTAVKVLKKPRAGSTPVSYDRGALFVSEMTAAAAQIMTAVFYTGMRPIEIFTLEDVDVDIEGRWIAIDKSKTGEARGIPIHEFLVPLFEALKARGGILFRSYKGNPYPPTKEFGGQINKAVTSARQRLEKRGIIIKDVSAYTGRHSVSTQLVVNGIHPYIKDQILGHAADDMSRHYTRVPQKPLIEAINTLPVPELWRQLEWWRDPVLYSRRLIRWGRAANQAKEA